MEVREGINRVVDFVRPRMVSLALILLVNWVFALVFMRFSSLCYAYVETEYE